MFLRAKRYLRVANPCPARSLVEPNWPCTQLRVPDELAATKMGPQPSHELHGSKWLEHKVIRATVKSTDSFAFVRTGRHDHDGYLKSLLANFHAKVQAVIIR